MDPSQFSEHAVQLANRTGGVTLRKMDVKWRALCVLLLGAAGLLGCGGAQDEPANRGLEMDPTMSRGSTDGPPRMSCTPTPIRDTWSERMEFAWLLTEQSFQLDAPVPPPPGSSTMEIQTWSGNELRNWLEEKMHLVEAAHEELNLAAEERHEQRVIAGALVGLMYEDLSRVMLDVPAPSDLRSEPEILRAFEDVVYANAEPYLLHSKRAYEACALNTRGHGDLAAWGEFCSGRRAGLPSERLDSGESETSVEVIME